MKVLFKKPPQITLAVLILWAFISGVGYAKLSCGKVSQDRCFKASNRTYDNVSLGLQCQRSPSQGYNQELNNTLASAYIGGCCSPVSSCCEAEKCDTFKRVTFYQPSAPQTTSIQANSITIAVNDINLEKILIHKDWFTHLFSIPLYIQNKSILC